MAQVTGLGGVLYKVKDPQATVRWYQEHLGIERVWGAIFPYSEDPDGYSVVEPWVETTSYFEPSNAQLMIDFRVDDLDGMIEQLQSKGVEILGTTTESDGKFAWFLDCDGLKIELWQQLGPTPPVSATGRSRNRRGD